MRLRPTVWCRLEGPLPANEIKFVKKTVAQGKGELTNRHLFCVHWNSKLVEMWSESGSMENMKPWSPKDILKKSSTLNCRCAWWQHTKSASSHQLFGQAEQICRWRCVESARWSIHSHSERFLHLRHVRLWCSASRSPNWQVSLIMSQEGVNTAGNVLIVPSQVRVCPLMMSLLGGESGPKSFQSNGREVNHRTN